jgi:hypothetical protein
MLRSVANEAVYLEIQEVGSVLRAIDKSIVCSYGDDRLSLLASFTGDSEDQNSG